MHVFLKILCVSVNFIFCRHRERNTQDFRALYFNLFLVILPKFGSLFYTTVPLYGTPLLGLPVFVTLFFDPFDSVKLKINYLININFFFFFFLFEEFCWWFHLISPYLKSGYQSIARVCKENSKGIKKQTALAPEFETNKTRNHDAML